MKCFIYDRKPFLCLYTGGCYVNMTTAGSLDEAATVYQSLEGAWTSGNMAAAESLLSQMKIRLLGLSFLPSGRTEELDPRKLLLARGTLEIGALLSIEKQDIQAFERYIAQLKCYYFDYAGLLPESACKYQILGLNLLHLLVQNRLAEFHTELELLSVEEHKNVYIKHPISLEQFLMEGSYHKVFLSKGNVPAKNYNYFIDCLINTIRGEIASCAERAYTQVGEEHTLSPQQTNTHTHTHKISVSEAAKLLLTNSDQELTDFAATRKWQQDMDGQFFVFAQEEKKEDLHFVRNCTLIQQALGYVRELEKIV